MPESGNRTAARPASVRVTLTGDASKFKVDYNIYHATPTDPLFQAHYLGDYEGIVVELDWASLTGVRSMPAPGYEAEWTEPDVHSLELNMRHRAEELKAFLASGGVLVVKVQAGSQLYSQNPYSRLDTARTATTDWLFEAVAVLWVVNRERELVFIPGSGREILTREPDHPFELAIRNADRYSALISKKVFQMAGSVLLATSRIGDPVAAEIPVGDGLVLLVPSGTDNEELDSALVDILTTRERYRHEWLLPEEIALIQTEKDLIEDTRQRRRALSERLEQLAAIRISIMEKLDVQRAVAYYEAGTEATKPIKSAMVELYKLVELLEAYFGGSEDSLAGGLGVSKSSFKIIKRLANQPKLDFRHAENGKTEGADVAEVERAREVARVLVQRFIEVSYQDEVARRSASE